MDITTPIDAQTSVSSHVGNSQLHFVMLARLEEMALSPCIEKISEGVEEEDWLKIKMACHSLKGSSGYVGAGRLHYACYYIQLAYSLNDY